MTFSTYFNIYYLIIAILFGYYFVRQRILTGAYAIAAFSLISSGLVFVSLLGFMIPSFRQVHLLFSYSIAIQLLALGLSYIPAIQRRLYAILKPLWFNSLISIIIAGILAIIFQIASQPIDANTPYTLNALTGCSYYTAFLFLLIAYYSVPLYYFHMNLKKYELIGFQLESILTAMDQELVLYKEQLSQLKTGDGLELHPLLVQALEEKLTASKLPIYADSTDVSMALYPYLNERAAANTWLDTKLLPMSTADLAFLLSILCSYFQVYDKNLLAGVQLTPLTEGKIYFELQSDLLASKHLEGLIKHQKMGTQSGPVANQQTNRMCLRYLLQQNNLILKHVVQSESRQAIVLYVQ